MSWILGLAWGALVAIPLVVRGRRVLVGHRVETLRSVSGGVVRTRVPDLLRRLELPRRARSVVDPAVTVVRALVSGRRRRANDAELSRELPVVIDVLAVAVAAGCTPYLAVEVAAKWGPPRSAAAFDRVLRSCALGAGFELALDDAARAAPLLRPLADALLASDRLGAPVGPQLARLAAEERTALRRRAEAHARRVPVKLLFPLVFLVLPAFVVLTVVPGLVAGLSRI